MNSSSTEFTARDGRRFGTQVGLAFLAFAALLLWRDHVLPAAIAGGLSAGLLLAGLVRPVVLGSAYRGWMAVALRISKVTNPILMSIIYFAVLTPTGLLRRLFGGNPLEHAPDPSGSFWIRRENGRTRDMRRQF